MGAGVRPLLLRRQAIPTGSLHRWPRCPFRPLRQPAQAVEALPRRRPPTTIRHPARLFLCPSRCPTTTVAAAPPPLRFRRVRFQFRCALPTLRLHLAPTVVVGRLHFLPRPARSRGHDHCRRLASRAAGAQRPSRPQPTNQRAQFRLRRRHPLPASPAEEERFSEDCSKTTNSASQSIHRQFRSAPMAAEAPRPCQLRWLKSRARCHRQYPIPASREEAAQPQLRDPKVHPLCPNVQSMAAEAQPHRQESVRAGQHHAIPATPTTAVGRPPKHFPRPDLLETFLPTMAAVQLHSALPARAACGRSRRRACPPEAQRFRPATIP